MENLLQHLQFLEKRIYIIFYYHNQGKEKENLVIRIKNGNFLKNNSLDIDN